MPRPLIKSTDPFAIGMRILAGLDTAAESPMPLDLALRDLVVAHQMEFVSFHRVGSLGGRLSIKAPTTYWILTATTKGLFYRDEIDDAIYDDLANQLTALGETPP